MKYMKCVRPRLLKGPILVLCAACLLSGELDRSLSSDDVALSDIILVRRRFRPSTDQESPTDPSRYETRIIYGSRGLAVKYDEFGFDSGKPSSWRIIVSQLDEAVSNRDRDRDDYFVDFQKLQFGETVLLPSGPFRLERLVEQRGERHPLLRLRRVKTGPSAVWGPHSLVIVRNVNNVSVGTRHRYTRVKIESFVRNGQEFSAVVHADRQNGRRMSSTVRISEGNLLFLSNGWHRVLSVVPGTPENGNTGWIEIDSRYSARRSTALSPQADGAQWGHHCQHRLSWSTSRISNDEDKIAATSLTLTYPRWRFPASIVAVNTPLTDEINSGKQRFPLFGLPHTLERGPRSGLFFLRCQSSVTVRDDHVPALDSIVVPLASGQFGWLAVGDVGTAKNDTTTSGLRFVVAAELRNRLRVLRIDSRDTALVEFSSPNGTDRRILEPGSRCRISQLDLQVIRLKPAGNDEGWIPWVEFRVLR